MKKLILKNIETNILTHKRILEDDRLINWIEIISSTIVEALKHKHKVFFAGNGGSFSDSFHIAAEFVGKFLVDREPMPAIALGGNNSIITAIGNDYSFEDIFSRELMALGMKGDVFVPISTSGNSKNILKAIKTAKSLGIETFGLTGGSGGSMISLCPCFCVPSKATPRIQEAHIMIGHIICEMVETKKYNGDIHVTEVSISRPAFSALTPELS